MEKTEGHVAVQSHRQRKLQAIDQLQGILKLKLLTLEARVGTDFCVKNGNGNYYADLRQSTFRKLSNIRFGCGPDFQREFETILDGAS